MITDLLVTLFVAILVVTSLYLSRAGDAIGRLLRGDGRGERRP